MYFDSYLDDINSEEVVKDVLCEVRLGYWENVPISVRLSSRIP